MSVREEVRTGAAVRARGIGHRYPGTPEPVVVLDGVDLDIAAGEHVALEGPSGSGKTTLLCLLGGLEALQQGELEVGGEAVSGLRGAALAGYRRTTIGFVFQHFGLLDALTAQENVELALSLSGMPRRRRADRSAELLARVGLGPRAQHRPAALSGGERQRVAIARALAGEPRLLLADEPTGNLDVAASAGVLDLLDEVRRDSGCTLVVVTHDPVVASRAGRRLRLDHGRVSEAGDAR
jgi:ABC-type lipoprotein export system ATPase subunit